MSQLDDVDRAILGLLPALSAHGSSQPVSEDADTDDAGAATRAPIPHMPLLHRITRGTHDRLRALLPFKLRRTSVATSTVVAEKYGSKSISVGRYALVGLVTTSVVIALLAVRYANQSPIPTAVTTPEVPATAASGALMVETPITPPDRSASGTVATDGASTSGAHERPLPSEMDINSLPDVKDLPAPKIDEGAKGVKLRMTSKAAESPTGKPEEKAVDQSAEKGGQPKRASFVALATESDAPAQPVAVQKATKQPSPVVPAPQSNLDQAPAAPKPPAAPKAPASAKFGWQGIAAITSTGVIVTSKDQGQRAVKIGGKLADGSELIAVDHKANKISTDRGTVTFTE